MEALDGNAIAGDLFDHFGVDMTASGGSCAHCGAPSLIAELSVYLRAPGAVVRCRRCGSVVMVLVSVQQTLRVDLSGFRLADAPAS
jgi:hypothetical protein